MLPEPAPGAARILVTGTGGPSGQSVMKALAEDRHEIFSADLDPYAAGLYMVDEAHRRLLPRGDSDEFPGHLLELCRELEIDVLIPTVDTELLPLAERREELASGGTKLVLASADTLRICLDKWELHRFCEGKVRVPECILVGQDFDPSAVELPRMVKPRRGSGSRGVFLADTISQLEALPRDETQLVQEVLPGIEYSVDVIARADGRVVGTVPRARLKVDSGIAVTGTTVRDEPLESIGRGVAESIGLTSVANVQVKEAAGGEPGLIEVNPRFPGTMPLTVASGINMPKLAVDEALGTEIPDGPLPFEALAMTRYMVENFFPVDELDRQVEAKGDG